MSNLSEMSRGLLTRVNTRINRFIHQECDFCFRLGHTFHECNDPELDTMLYNLYLERERIKTDTSHSDQHIDIRLYNYILTKANINDYGRRKWKSFAIKKTGFIDNSNNDINTWIFHIVDYVLQNDPEIIDDVSNNFIPFNENDAVSYLMNFNDIISNNQRDSEINDQTNNQIDSEINTNLVNEQLGFLILSVLQYERMRELFDEKRPINYYHKIELRPPSPIQTNLNNDTECDICCQTKKLSDFCKFNCKHQFCGECVENMMIANDDSDYIKCALCRTDVTKLETYDIESFNKIEKYIDSEYILRHR